jgi:hypothetical protein
LAIDALIFSSSVVVDIDALIFSSSVVVDIFRLGAGGARAAGTVRSGCDFDFSCL